MEQGSPAAQGQHEGGFPSTKARGTPKGIAPGGIVLPHCTGLAGQEQEPGSSGESI